MPQEYRKDPEAVSRLSPVQHRVTQESGTEAAAPLRFIPRDDLEREGYGEYRRLFEPRTG